MYRHPSASVLRRSRSHLKRGGVIAYATESCFGLGCDPRNARGLRTILRLKGRPNHKGMIVVGADIEAFRGLIRMPDEAGRQRLASRWPGPTTFLLPAGSQALPWLRGRHSTLAVRVPAHEGVAALTRLLGPLVSTSANPAGKRPLRCAAACHRVFGARLLTLPGRIGRRRRPSTIIDFASGRVLR